MRQGPASLVKILAAKGPPGAQFVDPGAAAHLGSWHSTASSWPGIR